MAAQLRVVRARIRAVKSIGKITRAQELIASSRIIRAQQRMRAAEPYARELTRAVEALVSRSGSLNHPMVSEPETVSRAAVLILTSDGGFAGGYNANVLRESARLRQRNTDEGVRECHLRGRPQGHRLAPLPRHRPSSASGAASPSGRLRRRGEGRPPRCSRLHRAGRRGRGGRDLPGRRTEFVSMLTQRPAVRRLLPLRIEERRSRRPAARCRPTNSSRPRRACSTRCCPRTSPAGSSTPCWTRRRRSRRPGGAR